MRDISKHKEVTYSLKYIQFNENEGENKKICDFRSFLCMHVRISDMVKRMNRNACAKKKTDPCW